MANDAVARGRDEVRDFYNLGVLGYLLMNLDDGIFEREVACRNQTEGIVDVAQATFVNFGLEMLHDHLVDTMEGSGIAAEDGIRKDIFLHAAAALEKGAFADADTVLHDAGGGEDGAIAYLTLGGNADGNAKDRGVADADVMADVYLVHQEVAIANGGGSVGSERTGDDDVLADDIVRANDHAARCAGNIVQILRLTAYDGILIDLRAAAERRAGEDAGIGVDDAIVANNDIAFYISEGTNLYITPYLRAGVNVC